MSVQAATLVDAAIEYARMGWRVFPCHPTGHQPLVERGFYAATCDEKAIEAWWIRWPGAAIGLRTGKESGVFAVDVDPRHGGDECLAQLEGEHGELPGSVESQTGGGGRHVLLTWPGRPVPCSTGKIGPGIDVKGDGGYIILPPSDHASGQLYCWLMGHEPGSHEIADAPSWLLDMIESFEAPSATGASFSTTDDDEIPEGYRNKTLTSQAGHMRQVGMTVEEIAPALHAINSRRCRPPLDDREVDGIARSIARYDPDTSRQARAECWPERYLGGGGPTPEVGPVLTCLADVQPSKVEWLWPRRMAIGKITMLAGDPGLGKSFCSIDIAARVSAGAPWPDLPDARQQPGGVIILSAEDALDDTIRPRLDAARADPSRVCALEAIRELDPMTGKPRHRGLHLDKDIANLEWALEQVPDCRLVVIDPISSYMGDANSHNNAEVRGLLAPLSELATRRRVAVLCISHLNKGAGDAMYRVMGSLAFVAAARAGYAVLKDAKDDMGERRLVLPIKNNLGDDKSGLAYRIMEAPGHDQPYVAWEPEAVYMTVSEALGAGTGKGEARDSPDDREQRKLQVSEAAEWLAGYLADGGKPAREVIEAAKTDGISQRTLERAKPEAQVVACREGFAHGGRWVWRKVDTEALVQQAKVATNA